MEWIDAPVEGSSGYGGVEGYVCEGGRREKRGEVLGAAGNEELRRGG